VIAAQVATVLTLGLSLGLSLGVSLGLPLGPSPGPLAGSPTGTTGERPDRDRIVSAEQPGTCHDPGVSCGHLRVPLDRRDASAGTVRLHYELYPRSDRSRPLLGTIVAVEGGPGYSTTGSRTYYRDLFEPLLDRRRLLLVDNRGTGRSEPIDCPQLQAYRGNYITAVARCGRQLGSASDLYGTAFAARDLVAVLDRLGIERVDLYGDSYGTFFSQAFAVRFPERLRTLILDAAYFVGGADPWYSDTNRALRHAFEAACRRSPPCARRDGPAMRRVARLAALLRRHPLHGRAPDADGVVRRVTVRTGTLVNLLTAAATTPTLYRELDAATRAVLRTDGYERPLLRLARESTYTGGAGPVRWFSEGLYVAAACNDYPQPYDMTAPPAARPEQYARSVRRLQRLTPWLFAPFGVREWVSSPYGYYEDCNPVAGAEPVGAPGACRLGLPRRADPRACRRPRLADLTRRGPHHSTRVPQLDLRAGGEHHTRDRAGRLRPVRLGHRAPVRPHPRGR